MAGYTKRISMKFLVESQKEFNNYVKSIIPILPRNYSFETIIKLLQKYYPYEWQMLDEKCTYYHIKDRKLKSVGKNKRHFIPKPKKIIMGLDSTKKVLDKEFIVNYKERFDEKIYNDSILKLKNNRYPKISKIKNKIEKAKMKAQAIEPIYLDKLIGLYDRKNTSQKDKFYIFKELEKYYCPKVISFFKKKVDTEYNRQLREMAFYHLQSLKHFAVLRKQKYMRIPSKNKKRREFLKNVYAYEKSNINSIPQELEYRINNSKEQKLKEYDFFISHSSADYKEVQYMIKELNTDKKNVYCDWISDTDYLKRHLVGDATKVVIEKRLEQSKNVLFIKSESALKSNWVKYELNYFNSLNKNIYEIDKKSILYGKKQYILMKEFWFLDENYKNIRLF